MSWLSFIHSFFFSSHLCFSPSFHCDQLSDLWQQKTMWGWAKRKFSLLTESTFHTFNCYFNINSLISESIIISLAACQPAWPECSMRTMTGGETLRMRHMSTAPKCSGRELNTRRLQIQLVSNILNTIDSLQHCQGLWKLMLNNKFLDSSGSSPILLKARISVSACKSRFLLLGICSTEHTWKEHWGIRSCHSNLIFQPRSQRKWLEAMETLST